MTLKPHSDIRGLHRLADLATSRGLTFRAFTEDERRSRRSNGTHALFRDGAVVAGYSLPREPGSILQWCIDLVVEDIGKLGGDP